MKTSNKITAGEFRDVFRKLEQRIDKQVGECCSGVSTAHCIALLEIQRQQIASVNSLAKTLKLDRSTISRTIESLVQKSLVSRTTNKKDRRSVEIKLTVNGQAKCDEIISESNTYFEQVLDLIPQSKTPLIVESIELLAEAMEQIEGHSEIQCECGCNN